ncbi:MAG: flagellar export chaperone FliS [Planctomycetota bacterium]
MQNPTFRAYLESKILTASPEQLQLMLYEGAIRFAQVAKMALIEKDYEKACNAFERVDGIVCELHGGLRPESDPELCDRFASLYNFCARKMLEANYSHSPDPIDDAILIFQHLRETWVLVLERLAEERSRMAERLLEVGVA